MRLEQHDAPTGRWCVGVRVSVRPPSVLSLIKVASALLSASEKIETVSVVSEPSAVAATISSPGVS